MVAPLLNDALSGHQQLAPGDVIAVHHRRRGSDRRLERSAVVLELPHGYPWPYRVRWVDNGLEELLYPRTDILIERRQDDGPQDGHAGAGQVTR